MRLPLILILMITILSFALGGFFWGDLPDEVVTHWNIKGEADGFSSKAFGVFLFPTIMLVLFILALVLPAIDPLKKDFHSYKTIFEYSMLVAVLFFVYIFALLLSANLGADFNMSRFIFPAVGVLLFVFGVMLKFVKRNWFMGIRTPWTISSDDVWERTNVLGSKLFRIVGIITIAGAFFPDYGLWILLIPLLASVLFLIIYSYVIFKA